MPSFDATEAFYNSQSGYAYIFHDFLFAAIFLYAFITLSLMMLS